MNRREFNLLTASASAALGIEPLSALEEFARNPALPLPPPPPQAPLRLSVNGLFMQDYSLGDPWSANPATSWYEPYVALDGSQHIFSVPSADPSSSFGLPVDRVFPARGTITGWDRQTMNVGPAAAGTNVIANTLVMVPSGTQPSDPGSPPRPPGPGWDMLLVFRSNSIDRCMIRPDGTLSNTDRVAKKSNSYPLVTGQLDPGTRYIPEVQVIGGVAGNVGLRSVKDPGFLYYVAEQPFAGVAAGANPRRPARVFPLKGGSGTGGSGTDSYRCITVDNSGNVRSLLLVRQGEETTTFNARESTLLAQSTSGCIHVHELVAGTVEVILFDVAGTPGIRSIAGSYDPQSVRPATWQPAVQQELTGFRNPFGATYSLEMVGAYHANLHMMDLFVMVRDSQNLNHRCEVWTTTRCHQGRWRQMLCVEKSCRTASVFRYKDTVKLLVNRALDSNPDPSQQRFQSEIWSRNVLGNWAIDVAVLPKDEGKPAAIPSYRVGVMLSQNGVSLPYETLALSASVLTVATVNGRRTVLPSGSGVEAQTESSGTVWIVLPLENRISFPTITIASSRFGPRLALPLNRAISDKLAVIQPSDLTTPSANGPALLDGQSAGLADDLARAIRSLATVGNQISVPQGTIPANVQLTSSIPCYWERPPGSGTPNPAGPRPSEPQPEAPAPPTNLTVIGADDNAQPPPPPPAPPSPAWMLTSGGRFQSISVDNARQQILTAIQTLVYAPPNAPPQGGIPFHTSQRAIWDDVWDDIKNAAEYVGGRIADGVSLLKDLVVRVSTFVMDGAAFLFKVVVNGIEYAYAGVIDTIGAAMDAINSLLFYAGALVGKAANWVLNQLGFLFDWNAIKARRTELKLLIKTNVGKVAQWMPDPTAAAATINSKISTFRATLQSYKSAAGNSTQISSRFPYAGGMPSYDSVAGSLGLPKLTMITDKVYGALEKVSNPFGLPSISVQDKIDLMADKVNQAMDFIPAMVQRFVTAFEQWISDPASFAQITGSAVIDLLLDEVDRVIQLLQDLVNLAAGAIKPLIDGAGKILEWLDTELKIGALSGFYYGLTDNRLSLLDVACLAAAICAPAAPARSRNGGVSRAAADTLSAARTARNAFLYAGIFTNTIDAFVSTSLAGTPYSTFTTALNLATLSGGLICALIDQEDLYLDVATGAAGIIAAILYSLFNKVFVIVGQVLLLAARVILLIYGTATKNARAVAYELASILQTFFSSVVNIATTKATSTGNGGLSQRYKVDREPLDPRKAAVYAGGQFILGYVCYYVQSGSLLPA